MRRNARSNQHTDDISLSSVPYNIILNDDSISTEEFLQLENMSPNAPTSYNNKMHRFENTIEAKVEADDTLQALALRFHCTVADIKRLNKIDKENEIHARKVVKIPVTVHNVLLDNLPSVHKSGNNSPKTADKLGCNDSRDSLSNIVRNPLDDAQAMLSEKLLVASVNSSGVDSSIKNKALLLSAKIETVSTNSPDDVTSPLLSDILDDSTNVPKLHRIRGPSLRAMDWSGSDCDMSWICLFVVILALCFVIPLIYVFYIAEHAHHNTTGSIIAPTHH